jgi:hypothetical protein
MVGKACSICAHINHDDIDAALLDGGKLIPTAQAFGLSKSAVARHKTNCLAPRIAAASRVLTPASTVQAEGRRIRAIAAGEVEPTESDLASLRGLTSRFARSLERLEGAADAAAEQSSYAALAALSGQIHKALESMGKMQGLYEEPNAETAAAKFSINIVLPG